MAEKFACTQCGFIFEDPDMEMCPRCGTELGKEWNPDELVDVLVTDLAGANVPDLIRTISEISGYPTQKIGPMLRTLPAVVYSGATPMQAEYYLEKLRATNAAAMTESAHDKSARLAAEAHAAAEQSAEGQARLKAEMELKAKQAEVEAKLKAETEAKKAEEARRQAEAKAKAEAEAVKAKAEAEAKAAEAKAKAEAETVKAKAEAEAEARAKAEAEAEKAKAEAEAKKAEEARRQAEAKAKAEAEAKLKAEAEAKAASEKAKAEAEARAKAEKAKAEAEAKKAEADAKLAAEKAKAEAEALAKAEVEKKRMELEAEEKAKRKAAKGKRNLLLIVCAGIALIAACVVGYFARENAKNEAERKAKAEAEAREKAREAAFSTDMLRNPAAWQTTREVVYTIGGVEFKFMPCPAGEFMMGSPENETGRSQNEKQHLVKITKPFLIGKYEITKRQYDKIQRGIGYISDGDQPKSNISFDDAVAFCDLLNRKTEGMRPAGYHFALPTDAQWEYACRAGTTSAFNNGKNLTNPEGYEPALKEIGWYKGNDGVKEDIGGKSPNAWGIYDMHGNVAERCMECDIRTPETPKPVNTGLNRGGGYNNYAFECRSAHRAYDGNKQNSIGFRVALVCENVTYDQTDKASASEGAVKNDVATAQINAAEEKAKAEAEAKAAEEKAKAEAEAKVKAAEEKAKAEAEARVKAAEEKVKAEAEARVKAAEEKAKAEAEARIKAAEEKAKAEAEARIRQERENANAAKRERIKQRNQNAEISARQYLHGNKNDKSNYRIMRKTKSILGLGMAENWRHFSKDERLILALLRFLDGLPVDTHMEVSEKTIDGQKTSVTTTEKKLGKFSIRSEGDEAHNMFAISLRLGNDDLINLVETQKAIGFRNTRPEYRKFAAVEKRFSDNGLSISIVKTFIGGSRRVHVFRLANEYAEQRSSWLKKVAEEKPFSEAIHYMRTADLKHPTVEIAEKIILTGDMQALMQIKENGFKEWKDVRLMIAAAKTPFVPIAEFLLDNGANVNAEEIQPIGDYKMYYYPLYYACQYGSLDMVKFLVGKGANINCHCTGSILGQAAAGKHTEIVKFLVEHGADVNEGGLYHYTALMEASKVGSIEIVKYLVGKGANVNAKNTFGETSLDIAMNGTGTEVYNYLFSVGARFGKK